jgi:thiopeptide-type bacteriocin biosynthesis protein
VLRRPLRSAASPLLGDFDASAAPDGVRRLLASDPILLSAVFLSSRSLFEATLKWLETQPDESDEVPAALTRYLARARSRSTPFGLFGLLSCGRVAETTAFPLISSPQQVRFAHRVSYEVETAEKTAWSLSRSVRTFARNPTLWRRGGDFLAWANLPSANECCALVTVAADDELSELFAERSEPVRVAKQRFPDISDLVEAGFLVECASQPALLEGSALLDAGSPVERAVGRPIDRFRQWIAALDDVTIDAVGRAETYAAVDGQIRQLLGDSAPMRPTIVASAFSRACERIDDPTLSQRTADEAARIAGHLVHQFGEPNRALRQLKKVFSEQLSYESIPLLEFLHGDLGKQFEQIASSKSLPPQRDYVQYDKYFLNQVLMASRDRLDEVKLTWSDIRSRLTPSEGVGDRLVSPIFSLVSVTGVAGDQERLCWGGMELATGTALLSRFETSDVTLHEHVTQWLQNNADISESDSVLAEVVHLPHPKLGDVLRRVARAPYAIFLTPPDVDVGPERIGLETLHVRCINDRFELWCSVLRKRVRPVLSVPHYHQGSMHPVYRFLCALATQDLESAQLRIPEAVRGLDHCPRVVVDGAIFRPETWTIDLPVGSPLRRNIELLRARLRTLGIPRRFAWSHLDRALVVDSDSASDLRSFAAAIGDEVDVRLVEVLDPHDGLVAHEIVLPVRVSSSETRPRVLHPTLPVRAQPRQFPPGGEYAYVQLFADMARVDRLPQEIHSRLGKYLKAARLLPFYTKYSVPAPHLRFRVRGPAESAWRLMQRVCRCAEDLRAQGWIDRFAIATYEPEIERYGGGELWKLSESYFAADSTFARVLSSCVDDQGLDNDSLLFAMATSCLYVGSDFGFSLERVASLLGEPNQARPEGPSAVAQASGALLRAFQGKIAEIASGKISSDFVRFLLRAAHERTQATRDAREELMRSLGTDGGWRTWLFRSHSHMSMNRMTRTGMVDAEQIANALATRVAAALAARGMHTLPSLVA